MTTRSPGINPLLAAVGALLLVALAVSLAHSKTGSSPPDPDPARGGFHIQGTDLGVFLVDSRTGDTWKWFYNHEEGSMGWQYHTVPAPIGGCLREGAESYAKRLGPSDSERKPSVPAGATGPAARRTCRASRA